MKFPPLSLTLLLIYGLAMLALAIPGLQREDGGSAETGAPYVLLEAVREAEIVGILEDAGLGPVIGADSVRLALSRISALEFLSLEQMSQRQQDPRIMPGYRDVLEKFRVPGQERSLLYIMGTGDYRRVEAALGDYPGPYFIHSDRNPPRFTAVILWIALMLPSLLLFERPQAVLLSGMPLLPLALWSGSSTWPLIILLFLALRDLSQSLWQRWEPLFSGRSGPEADAHADSVMGIPAGLSLDLITAHMPGRALWVLLISLACLVLGLIQGVWQILLLLPLLLVHGLVHLLLQRNFALHQRQHEHELFFALPLTPAWDKPLRKERLVSLVLLVLALALPWLVELNTAPFATEFLSVERLGSLESGEDIGLLRQEVLAALNVRMRNETGMGLQTAENPGSPENPSSPEGPVVQEPSRSPDGQPAQQVPALFSRLLADRAFQQFFNYVSLSAGPQAAGRYENGRVYLSRFIRGEQGLSFFEEEVFVLDEAWIRATLESASDHDVLRLYSDGQWWYDVRPEQTMQLLSPGGSPLFQTLLLLLLGFPWLGRWHFAPLEQAVAGLKSRRRRR